MTTSGDDVNAKLIDEFRDTSQLGSNGGFIEDLYESWLREPDSVSADWRDYFQGLRGREAGDVPHSDAIARIVAAQKRNGHTQAVALPTDIAQSQKQAAVLRLVTAYRSRGHLAADLDPLELMRAFTPDELRSMGLLPRPAAPDLDPISHGLGCRLDRCGVHAHFRCRAAALGARTT